MNKVTILLFFCIGILSSHAQQINEVQAYSKLGALRVVAITDGEEPYLYTPKEGWNLMPKGELPKGKVMAMGAYHQTGGSKLMVAMEDNSIWKMKDETWTQVNKEGLPEEYNIRLFRAYTDYKVVGSTGKAVFVTDKGEIWHYNDGNGWTNLDKTGLPAAELTQISTFQKVKGVTHTPSFIVTLADRSVFKRSVDDDSWKLIATRNFPKDYKIKTIDSYLKTPLAGSAESRIICSLNDGSIWWTSEKESTWLKISTTGLPKNYRIKKMKVFQKNNSSRILLLLEDSTLWWYTEGEGFNPIDMKGLKG